ncbi:hypothetical protein G6011_07130 [Alternaria panax]|uniref:Uncharacterized protein n=1 Tax=Alternaria panax TaxID=48097 RepID=A0AAD4F8L1_9PLEO|nr:hypothetical protein G6011_07130 [Alternaria panax]
MADSTPISDATDALAAMQLRDTSTNSVSIDQQHFHFLDLAAEIRNRIYDLVAEPPEPNETRSPGNGVNIGLTQVCRQIRNEFRNIYLQKMPFAVTRKDIESFVKAFFWLDDTDQKAPTGHYPTHVHYLHTQSTTTDILPLLNLKMHFPQLNLAILPDPEDGNECYWIADMCRSISELLVLRSPRFRHDLQAQKVSEFCCHCDGRFYVWYKPGQEPYGFDMALDKEGQEFADETHRILGVEERFGTYCSIAFDGIDEL